MLVIFFGLCLHQIFQTAYLDRSIINISSNYNITISPKLSALNCAFWSQVKTDSQDCPDFYPNRGNSMQYF